MANSLRIKRGTKATIPTLAAGEPGWCTDTFELFVGDGTTNRSTAPVKATGAELDTGTDDLKFANALAIKNSKNVPSVVPSTAGKVMTSDGTDWISAVPSGGGFDPTTTIEIMEDFAGGSSTSGHIGENNWIFVGAGVTSGVPTIGRVGVIRVRSGSVAGNGTCLGLVTITAPGFMVGNQNNCISIFSIRNSQIANTDATLRIGFFYNMTSAIDPVVGIYFRAIGTGNWFAITRMSDVETATNTGIAQTTTFKQFKIVSNVDGTSIDFYIDGVLKATHTTNIPTVSIAPIFQIVTATTTIYYLDVDYFYLKVTGLTR